MSLSLLPRAGCLGAVWLAQAIGPGPPTVTIDRIEGEQAVVEWSADHRSAVPLELLPPGIREGDRLQLRWRTVPSTPLPAQPLRSLPTAESLAPPRVQLRASLPLARHRRKDTQ